MTGRRAARACVPESMFCSPLGRERSVPPAYLESGHAVNFPFAKTHTTTNACAAIRLSAVAADLGRESVERAQWNQENRGLRPEGPGDDRQCDHDHRGVQIAMKKADATVGATLRQCAGFVCNSAPSSQDCGLDPNSADRSTLRLLPRTHRGNPLHEWGSEPRHPKHWVSEGPYGRGFPDHRRRHGRLRARFALERRFFSSDRAR